jgi:type 1 glutamine amidotransferase
MKRNRFAGPAIVFCAAVMAIGALTSTLAQMGGGRGGSAVNVFTSADADKDGAVTRDELKAAFAKWTAAADAGKTGSITQEQLAAGLNQSFPQPAPGPARGPTAQNQTPKPDDVERMTAALPGKAPAKPKAKHKLLVLSKAAGFVHSCIPLAAKTVEAMGNKTGAWATTITYDPADINADSLKQYDAVFLNNTTGAFLDDPNPEVTAARKAALLNFVRSGKGLAGIHAAGDAYHEAARSPQAAAPRAAAPPRAAFGPGTLLAGQIMTEADRNGDKKLTADEMSALADAWFDKMDTEKGGRITRQVFTARFSTVLPAAPPRSPAPAGPAAGRPGRDNQVGTWMDYDNMIGGMFKFHWTDPTHIVYKIDDPSSPLNAMFKGIEFSIDDETYTFSVSNWSRANLHVLTSIDYAKMSEADKLKEDYPREDHDYGLSWIRREGKGRVFYEAHGHNEKVYAIKPMLEHLLAGVQYALGDLKANDAPSAKAKK